MHIPKIGVLVVFIVLPLFSAGSVASAVSSEGSDKLLLETNSAGSPRVIFTIKAITSLLLAPLLLPLLILALPLILLLLLPVPVVTIPTGRKRTIEEGLTRTAKQLWRSESCMERVACEMANAVRKLDFLNINFLQRFTDTQSNGNNWMDRVSRAAEKDECSVTFSCDPIGSLHKGFMQ